MSMCGEADPDVHAFIKELATRRAEQRSKIHSNESRHLAEEVELVRPRWRFVLFYSRCFHSASDIISSDRV